MSDYFEAGTYIVMFLYYLHTLKFEAEAKSIVA